MVTTLAEAVETFKGYGPPRRSDVLGPHNGLVVRFACTVESPASEEEIAQSWRLDVLPVEVCELWAICRSADLFVDIDYGQWGLELLSPSAAAADTADQSRRRSADLVQGDVVIGRFLGDGERLVYTTDQKHGSQIIVMLEIDEMEDFPLAATSLAQFLTLYWTHQGEKFWNSTGTA